MSILSEPLGLGITAMSAYELQVWESLSAHWEKRNNKRGLPNWASTALERSGHFATGAASRVKAIVPEVVKQPITSAGETVANAVAKPTIKALANLLELTNDVALELNNPKGVEKLARRKGLEIESFSDLRKQDLKVCDRLLTSNTLKWRGLGALEGGGMGLLALVPVAGMPIAMGADILVIQVLSTSIAARIAYSYGYDAKDPAEQLFIEGLVRRSFIAQAAKVEPLRDVARAANAIKDRVRWSDKLRADHRLLAALEKLMQHVGPTGSRVSVQSVAKVVPFIGIAIGASVNSTVLANVAADAQRYCQTRHLCEKYGLPLPVAMSVVDDDDLIDESS